MLSRDDLLVILIEECGEVIQAATKCLRFGWDRYQPGYGINCEILAKEVGDLLGMVEAEGLFQGSQRVTIDAHRETKMARVLRFAAQVAAEREPSHLQQEK